MIKRLSLGLLGILCVVALMGSDITPPIGGGGGGGLDSYANYASLPGSASDGDAAKTIDDGRVYVYNTTLSLWSPPELASVSSLIADLDMDVLPTADTPAWAKGGTGTTAVAGNELTITLDAANYANYTLTSATDIVSTKKVGMSVRVKVTAQQAAEAGWKGYIAIRPSNLEWGAVTLARGTSSTAADNVWFMSGSSGGGAWGAHEPTTAIVADISVYFDLFLWYDNDLKTYSFWTPGGAVFTIHEATGSTSYFATTTARFGASSASFSSTLVFANVKVFKF